MSDTRAFSQLKDKAAQFGLVLVKQSLPAAFDGSGSRRSALYTITTTRRLRQSKGDLNRAAWFAGEFRSIFYFLRGFEEGRRLSQRRAER